MNAKDQWILVFDLMTEHGGASCERRAEIAGQLRKISRARHAADCTIGKDLHCSCGGRDARVFVLRLQD